MKRQAEVIIGEYRGEPDEKVTLPFLNGWRFGEMMKTYDIPLHSCIAEQNEIDLESVDRRIDARRTAFQK